MNQGTGHALVATAEGAGGDHAIFKNFGVKSLPLFFYTGLRRCRHNSIPNDLTSARGRPQKNLLIYVGKCTGNTTFARLWTREWLKKSKFDT